MNYDKKYEKSSMPYSDGHRVKVRAWQTLVVLLDFLDPATYPGSADFIALVNKHLWKIIGLNHLQSIRAYIEIFMIKFALMYPQHSVEDPLFVKTLLDPNVKQTVASSHLIIAGFILQHLPSGGVKTPLKQRLLEHMSGFLTSNGAHVRCIA